MGLFLDVFCVSMGTESSCSLELEELGSCFIFEELYKKQKSHSAFLTDYFSALNM
jgi:hypothetical protein